MYKIEQLSSLVEEIKTSIPVLPENLVDFANELQRVEMEFQLINHDYKIEIKPEFYNNNPSLSIELFHNHKSLFNYNTSLNFYQYEHSSNYERAEDHALTGMEYILKQQVTFEKEPTLYKEIVQDKLISAFLSNEKTMRIEQAARSAIRMQTI